MRGFMWTCLWTLDVNPELGLDAFLYVQYVYLDVDQYANLNVDQDIYIQQIWIQMFPRCGPSYLDVDLDIYLDVDQDIYIDMDLDAYLDVE